MSQHRSYMKRREETIKNNKEWAKNNRDKVRSYKRKYQARLEGLKKEQDYNPDYNKVLEREGYFCYLCQTSIEPGDHHYDHIIPITKGGCHAEFNLSIAHSACNISKQNKLPDELNDELRGRVLAKLEQLKAPMVTKP